MTLGNDRKELRKGEKLTVTIEDVLHNTILVYLEYRRTKFCGVLLNTSNRRGPYGIEEEPTNAYYRAYDIDPKKLAADELKNEKAVKKVKIPAPQPLETRTTYGQKVQMPPPRQIYNRKRRSKRRVRIDMMSTDEAIRLHNANSGRKLLSHHSTCCCDTCAAGGLQKLSTENRKPVKGKRKLLTGEEEKPLLKTSKRVWVDGVVPLTDDSKRIKIGENVSEKVAENKENPEEEGEGVKRSPIIKISYKSPGGKGRVLKIPSRIHASPNFNKSSDADDKKAMMQERARKVVNRAKSEHFKYLQEKKANTQTSDSKKAVISKDEEPAAAISKKSSSDKPSPGKVKEIPPGKVKEIPGKVKEILPGKVKEIPHEETEPKEIAPKKERQPSISPRKRETRSNLHPTVVLKPLQSDNTDAKVNGEDVPDTSRNSPASAPSQSSVKSRGGNLHHDSNIADEASDQSPTTSQSTMTSTSTEPEENKKLKRDSSQTHSISVTRCTTLNGVQWCHGDVVWGKIVGFPWWPGIIRKITVKVVEGKIEQEAVVDWFRSKTVSHISCNALESFSRYFSKRYEKKRKGNYRQAINEAKEAEKNMSPEVRALITQFET